MELFTSIALGVVQGLTEFLPVSSSGHLVLMHEVFGQLQDAALRFDVMLHFATALAVIVYFRRDLWSVLQSLLRVFGRLPADARDITLFKALLIGTIPGALAGFFFEDIITAWFRSPIAVAVTLVVGSLLFILAERRYLAIVERSLSVRAGFLIGLFQCLALIPGFSRSGATIAGGMLLGLSREAAARFSFLLALPIILGATLKQLLDMRTAETGDMLSPVALVAGGVAAFVVALLAIRFMLGYVRKHSLYVFVWYRLILAAVVIALSLTV